MPIAENRLTINLKGSFISGTQYLIRVIDTQIKAAQYR